MLLSLQVYLAFFACFLLAQAQRCPELYKRFSDRHTFCLAPNKACNIIRKGVTESEKQEILQAHNQYRSKIAMGKESRAGGMPQAADMLEMVWDNELAAVAQKLTDSCVYEHDCNSCRRVNAFSVGQNIGESEGVEKAGWAGFIDRLYNEVQFFKNRIVKSYVGGPSGPKQYGHFTQVVWGKSWRIGCGWTLYKEGSTTKSFTACNYGPGGNVKRNPMYTIGKPCSKCPSNTCCGSSCAKFGVKSSFQGLCKVIDIKKAPKPVVDLTKYSVYCDFSNQPDCEGKHEGVPWRRVETPGGNWLSIVLSGGQKSTMHFPGTIKSSGSACFQLETRSAANNFKDDSRMKVISKFNIPAWGKSMDFTTSDDYLVQETKEDRQSFLPSSYGLGVRGNMKFSLELSVPPGAPPQFFEIRKFSAKDGSC